MKKNFFMMLKSISCFFMLFFTTLNLNAQVGIGTTTPNASSMLDISSTTSGLLTPRMTTAERTVIATPADGLIVYDTDLKSFYHYIGAPTSKWSKISSEANGRLNFKRIKSTDVLSTVLATELTAGGGTKYILNTNTLYEINGTVTLDKPIDLNNAYIQGIDSGDDKITSTGNVFDGATGGTIKGLTLTSSTKVFNLSGTAAQNLIFRDCIVANSASVGTITDYGLVFVSIVQFAGNTNGITYSNISQLLLSNLGWFGNNSGTFEKLIGTFGLVQKQGGFSEVNGTAIGFDVSTTGLTINNDAVMESVVFTGTLSTGTYVKGYTTGTYAGYNFNNSWSVRCAGIPTESDAVAGGGFSMDYGVGTGISVGTNNSNPSDIVKVGTALTVSPVSNLFRFSSDSPNRLRYLGKKKRIFQISGSISVQVPNAATYIVYLAKNSTPISQYKVYGRGQTNGDILVLPLNGNIELNNNDFVEIYLQRFTGSTVDPIVANLTLIVK